MFPFNPWEIASPHYRFDFAHQYPLFAMTRMISLQPRLCRACMGNAKFRKTDHITSLFKSFGQGDGFHGGFGFVEAFVVFAHGRGVGDEAASCLDVGHAVLECDGAKGDAGI